MTPLVVSAKDGSLVVGMGGSEVLLIVVAGLLVFFGLDPTLILVSEVAVDDSSEVMRELPCSIQAEIT